MQLVQSEMSPLLEAEHPVTSEPMAITLGTVSVEADALVNVTSPQLSSTLDSVSVIEGTGVTVTLTGLAATTALGTAQAAIPITVTLGRCFSIWSNWLSKNTNCGIRTLSNRCCC